MGASAGLLAALLLVAVLLAVPVELRFWLGGGAGAPSRVEVAWLFGWVRRELRRTARGSGPRRWPRVPWARLRELRGIWEAGLGRRCTRLLRSLRRWIRIRKMRVRARFGLGDPADTGMLLGHLHALAAAAAAALPGLDLRLEPDFQEAVLAGDVAGDLRIVPLGALPLLVAFALSPSTLRAVRVLRRGAA